MISSINSSIEMDWYPNALASCQLLDVIGCWFAFDMIIGVIFNILVIVIYLRNKDLHSTTNAFIVSISICDLVACLVEIPLPLIASFLCKWPFGKYGCYFEAFSAYFCGCASMYLLTFVSIDRFIAISYPFEHQRVTLNVQRGCIAASLLIALFWSSAPLFGWSSYTLEGALISCAITWQDKSPSVVTYTVLIFIFVLFLPVCIMIACNLRLYLTIRNISRNSFWNKDDPKTKKKLKAEKRVAKSSIMMVAGFLLAWSPYACVSLISAFGNPQSITPLMATLPALFAKSQVIWNPIIYVAFNKNFRSKLFNKSKKPREDVSRSIEMNQQQQSKKLSTGRDESPNIKKQSITKV